MAKCNARTEVYTRVVGFMRPVQSFNAGKAEEYKDRRTFNVDKEISDG